MPSWRGQGKFYIIMVRSNTKPQAPDNRKMSHVKPVYMFMQGMSTK
jgi:hypothetical protein